MMLTFGLVACNKKEENHSIRQYETLIEGKLYYIPDEEDGVMSKTAFKNSYEYFLKENPNLEVIDISDHADTTTNNSVKGYYIFTK